MAVLGAIHIDRQRVEAHLCGICGALVLAPSRHKEWHDREEGGPPARPSAEPGCTGSTDGPTEA